MSFREKSAWVMAAVVGLAGLYYLDLVLETSRAIGETAPPAAAIAFVMLVVIGSIVVQVALAIASPREAGAPADEREKMIEYRAGHWSGILLGAGLVTALGHYLFFGDGNLLFHAALGALIVAQLAEYGLAILYFRRGV